MSGTVGSHQGSYPLASPEKKGPALRERMKRSAEESKLRQRNDKRTATIRASLREPFIASGTSQRDLIRCDVQ